jgi:hypothetical protein
LPIEIQQEAEKERLTREKGSFIMITNVADRFQYLSRYFCIVVVVVVVVNGNANEFQFDSLINEFASQQLSIAVKSAAVSIILYSLQTFLEDKFRGNRSCRWFIVVQFTCTDNGRTSSE